ncbi:MAG TPA: PIN domain-containing protein [Candidatus Thermoplasmatota archaeon]|nr:PIN domain-containing protein [Candidatus Thermoplasmatota archaeon]
MLKDGLTREIITSNSINFYSIDYVIEELNKYQSYILKKAHMSKTDFDLLFDLVFDQIQIVDDNIVKKYMNEAMSIMKDIDIKDSPILACALSIPNEGIWTADKDFEKQTKIPIWKTKELKDYVTHHRK